MNKSIRWVPIIFKIERKVTHLPDFPVTGKSNTANGGLAPGDR